MDIKHGDILGLNIHYVDGTKFNIFATACDDTFNDPPKPIDDDGVLWVEFGGKLTFFLPDMFTIVTVNGEAVN